MRSTIQLLIPSVCPINTGARCCADFQILMLVKFQGPPPAQKLYINIDDIPRVCSSAKLALGE